MSTPLSLEFQIEKLMDLYKVRQEPLGMYARGLFGVSLSGTTISSGLRGTRPFANDVARLLFDTLKEIQKAQQLLEPLPIDWTDVRACLPILERMRAGQPIIPLAATTAPPLQTEPTEPDIDVELVACVSTGDYNSLCTRRGWDRGRLMNEISANAEKMRLARTELAAINRDRARLQQPTIL